MTVGLAVLAVAAAGTARGQVAFVEVGRARGILPYDPGPGYGAGVSVADYDEDGDLDVFVPNGPGAPDQLYRNLGKGRFREIAAEAGVAWEGPSRTALWLDFDGDGRLDLVVAGDCFDGGAECLALPTLRFLRQDPSGRFQDVTAAMGIDEDGVERAGQHRGGLVGGDLDGDGWPDVVTGLWGGPALVLKNKRGRGFTDIGSATGIARASLHHWQPAMYDLDRDGRADLYWATDFTANHLWINRGALRLEDVAPRLGVDNAMNDMGLVLADYDNDGDADLFVTEIAEFDLHNVLYRNDRRGATLAFTETARAAGIAETGFAWGATFFDADNDGWLDLAVTNGWFNGIGHDDASRFFLNRGTDPVAFEDRSKPVGFDDRRWGVSLAAFDMDRDGDLDLVQTCNLGGPVRLLENRPRAGAAANHWIVIRPRSGGPNTHAIGAVVRVEIGSRRLMRPITAGTGHLGQEPAEAFFGLGGAERVDRVLIAWPDGAQTIRRDLPAGAVVTIRRSPCPGTADLDGDGAIGFADLLLLLPAWGPCPTRCPQDLDGSGTVGLEDLLALIAGWGPCGGPGFTPAPGGVPRSSRR